MVYRWILGNGGNDVSGTRLFQSTTSVGNGAGTAETDLHVFTLPASTLVTDADAIRILTWVQCLNNNNSKRARVYFGATTIGDSTQQNFNNVAFLIEAWVFRTSATAQKALVGAAQPNVNTSWATAEGGGLNTSTPAEALSGTVSIRITGQSVTVGNAGDVTALATVIDYFPAV